MALSLPHTALAAGATGAVFLRSEQSARMVGLGGAFAALADDGDATYWNPAGLGFQNRTVATLTHYQGFVDLRQEYFNAVRPMGKLGTFGVDAIYSTVGDVNLYDDFGLDIGDIQNYDVAVEASWGRAWRNRVALGAGLKFYMSRLAEAKASGLATDLGFLFRPDPERSIFMGASLQNLGPGIKYIAVADPLPLNLKAGLSYRFPLRGGHTLLGSLEMSRILYKYEWTYLNTGAEYVYQDMLSLRAGFRLNRTSDKFTVGAGIRFSPVRADYSFVPFATLGGTHRISLGYEFAGGAKVSPSPSPLAMAEGEGVVTPTPSPTISPPQDFPISPTPVPTTTSSPTLPLRGGEEIRIPYNYAFRLSGDLLFEPGSAFLKPEASSTLIQAARLIRDRYQDASILVIGHTDSLPLSPVSGLGSNHELSLGRARVVADIMAGQGLEPGRFQIQGAGETKPVGSNHTEEGRAANRRVEVLVTGERVYTVEALLSEASSLMAQKDWNGALRLLIPGSNSSPENAALFRLLGSALVQSGDKDRGIPYLRRALELNQGDQELKAWLEELDRGTQAPSP